MVSGTGAAGGLGAHQGTGPPGQPRGVSVQLRLPGGVQERVGLVHAAPLTGGAGRSGLLGGDLPQPAARLAPVGQQHHIGAGAELLDLRHHAGPHLAPVRGDVLITPQWMRLCTRCPCARRRAGSAGRRSRTAPPRSTRPSDHGVAGFEPYLQRRVVVAVDHPPRLRDQLALDASVNLSMGNAFHSSS